ncbi:hypothetical protein Bca52824_019395 [Brassica carinata]|uniref:Fatty acid hydroxylase domain-containing protein n=1 Tax=Brassica carinata TaxID=52824 RepID=A0A8X7VSF2_BRACI|nr:hypothetical protein Bca52824_019395 [Brassica carinata]
MAVENEFLTQFVEETTFYNRIILSHLLPANLWEPLPHFLQTWLRNYLAGNLLYFISGSDSIPTKKAMIMQIHVAMKAMPWYTLLPTVSEYMIERGWTKCYSTLDHFNWFLSLVYIALYLLLVEARVPSFGRDTSGSTARDSSVHIANSSHNASESFVLEGIWTASIHDCIHGNIWPIMGAGYHTIHHTTYKHNYGHYTIWMDWMFGTLVPLAEDDNEKVK